MMRLYWIEFVTKQWPLNQGVGVTAYDEDEAVRLAAAAFAETELKIDEDAFKGASVKIIDSLDDLDQGHVRPNMGNHMKRGVWFPLLKSDGWNR